MHAETALLLGFYGVTYYIGFREDFEVNVSRYPPTSHFYSRVLMSFQTLYRGDHREDLLTGKPW